MGESATHADVAAVLVQVNVTEPVPVFEVHVGVVVSNEAIAGSTVGELTGEAVAAVFVGVGLSVGFGVGFGVGLAGAAVVVVAALAGAGVAVTVSVAVAVTTTRDGGATVVAGGATTADAAADAELAGALVAGALEEDAVAAAPDGLVDCAVAWCEPDEHAASRTVSDALAMIARRQYMVVPFVV